MGWKAQGVYNAQVSVSFHLCQPGRGASCGACCGLYNLRDHSRATITERLAAQTVTFGPLPQEPEALAAREDEEELSKARELVRAHVRAVALALGA
jgi:hypothetical protein